VDDDEYWDFVVGVREDPILWVKQDKYYVGDLVSWLGTTYRCKSEHYPATGQPPGVSSWAWNVRWEVVQGFYHVGDQVSRHKWNYTCIADHVPSEENRPSDGTGSWGSFWEKEVILPNNFYVDSGVSHHKTFTGTMFDGLDHLKGETVHILANGCVLQPRTVDGQGRIFFNQPDDPQTFTSLVAGLPYESVLEPMALEAGMENGTSVAREKRIHEVVIYFHESGGCKVADRKTGAYEALPFRTADMIADQAAPLFTGPYVHTLESRHDMEASFVLKQDLPLPMTVLAVVPKWNIYGDQG